MYEHDLIRQGFVRLDTLEDHWIVSDGYCTYVPIYPVTIFEQSIEVPSSFRLFYNSNHRCYAILQKSMLVKPLFESPIYRSNKDRRELAMRRVWKSAGSKEG